MRMYPFKFHCLHKFSSMLSFVSVKVSVNKSAQFINDFPCTSKILCIFKKKYEEDHNKTLTMVLCKNENLCKKITAGIAKLGKNVVRYFIKK